MIEWKRKLVDHLPVAGFATFDVLIAVIVATIFFNAVWMGDLSAGVLFRTAYIVVWFSVPALVFLGAVRRARHRYGIATVSKAGTSVVLAVGVFYAGRAVVEFSTRFVIPFVSLEASRSFGSETMTYIEAAGYVVEGIVWFVPMAFGFYPGVQHDMALGVTALAIGLVLEGSRLGLIRATRRVRS